MESLADRLGHDVLRRAVQERYGRVVTEPDASLGFPVGREFAEAVGYPPALLDRFPTAAASFTGVGTPINAACLQPGETVLELGCGAGLDTAWAAAVVGTDGKVIALDMALPMVAAMRRNTRQDGLAGVLPLVAVADALPLPNHCVDVVLVNGIFNLSPDKAAVLREIRRVLHATGRLVASEVALSRALEPGEASTLDDWFRWIGGALPEASLLALLEAHELGPVTAIERTRNARTSHPASIALTLVAGPRTPR